MVNVNKQQGEIVDFFCPPHRLGRVYQNVYQIQKVDEQRVIQLLQFLLSIEVLRIKSPDLLTFQRPNDGVVVCEVVSEMKRES